MDTAHSDHAGRIGRHGTLIAAALSRPTRACRLIVDAYSDRCLERTLDSQTSRHRLGHDQDESLFFVSCALLTSRILGTGKVYSYDQGCIGLLGRSAVTPPTWQQPVRRVGAEATGTPKGPTVSVSPIRLLHACTSSMAGPPHPVEESSNQRGCKRAISHSEEVETLQAI